MRRVSVLLLLVLVLVVVLLIAGCQQSSSPKSSRSPQAPAPKPRPSRTRPPARPDLAGFFGGSLNPRRAGSFGLDRAGVLSSGDPRFPWLLRVRYPAGSASPAVARGGAPAGGAQSYLELRTGPVDALHLRYYVRFPVGFEFVKGGKLPGLYGGRRTSGGRIPDGTDGLSTRFMWRREGDGEVYAYLPASRGHGTSLGRGAWVFAPGTWICVEQAVRLNTPGRADGVITVWIDGRQVYEATGLTFRTTRALQIEGVFFSTFFGGGDRTWASPRDQYADFAAFAVSDHRIGPLPTR